MNTVKAIILPVRPQPDTLAAIFLLKRYGKEQFPGIEDAKLEIWQKLEDDGKTGEDFENDGYILIDIGGGKFDHHDQRGKTTASQLVADFLGVSEEASIAKLLEYVRRDDFFGKGTVSEDPLDRAFGLSGIITALNKSLPANPQRIVEIIMPILAAHHNEELKRTKELPEEFHKKVEEGAVHNIEVRQRGKKLKVVFIESESSSMAGYLRSQDGGKFDVVVQRSSTGHINILTRQAKHLDLRSLAVVLRMEELSARSSDLEFSVQDLARTGRIREIPEWYYDRATNTIQNGGVNPKEVTPTQIPWGSMPHLLEVGLSEQIWSPVSGNFA